MKVCARRPRRVRRQASRSDPNIAGIEVVTARRRPSRRHRGSREEMEHPALDDESGREPEAARRRGRDPRDADADSRRAGEQVMRAGKHVLIEIPIADTLADSRSALRMSPRDRCRRHGRTCPPLQSQPSICPQQDQSRRAEDPADGRADLLLPPHQHERARPAAHLDRSSAVASCLPHHRSLPVADRRDRLRSRTPSKARSIPSSASRWIWASS